MVSDENTGTIVVGFQSRQEAEKVGNIWKHNSALQIHILSTSYFELRHISTTSPSHFNLSTL